MIFRQCRATGIRRARKFAAGISPFVRAFPPSLATLNTPILPRIHAVSEENIKLIPVDEEVKSSFLDYSMSVIISRALPDARDGLKPSQRRLLFAMSELGVLPNRKHIKSAKIVGETMGNYHPHGDQAIYPTLVNMAQPW